VVSQFGGRGVGRGLIDACRKKEKTCYIYNTGPRTNYSRYFGGTSLYIRLYIQILDE
jgi:hypothetical protein